MSSSARRHARHAALALGLAAVTAFGGEGRASEKRIAPAGRPNFLVIVADDLGWGDLSAYGQRQWQTPTLDRLASQGTLFTQGYMPSAVCSPSRAGLLTGRWPAEFGLHGHLADSNWNQARGMPDFLDPAVPTLPRLLQQAGYRTIHVGKWHLGPYQAKGTRISDYGFDDIRWPHCYSEDRIVNLWARENRPRATAELASATLAAIREAHEAGRPFYAQLWLNDPHAELAPAQEDIDRFNQPVRERKLPYTTPFSLYAATVTAMDRQLAVLLDGLEQLGLGKNTVVIFTSDNGPEDIEIRSAQWSGVGSAGPLRGRKRSLYEGGVRVPWIVRWTEASTAGAVNDQALLSAVDLFPTIASLAGASIPQDLAARLVGEDASAAWRGDHSWRRKRPLLWEWREEVVNHPWNRSPMLAIREGDWKLLMNPDRSRIELYNIVSDPREQDNLARLHPEIVERLAAQALAWQATLPPGRIDPRAGKDDYPWPAASPRTR